MRLPGKAFKNLFGGGDDIDVPELPPVPQRSSEVVDKAGEAEKALRRRRGRRATQLTGGRGVEDEAPVKRKTLGAG